MSTEIINEAASKTPADMISFAIANGADLEKLEKLLDLQQRYEANEARKAYHRAMADFKLTPLEIEKDKKVGYSTSRGNVNYSHATLANVVRTITKGISKYGLSASWRTSQDNGKVCVTCIITHLLGHSEETTLCASPDESGSKNSIQAIGSTVTYLERYTLLASLGLATTDQDDDAKTVEEKFITETQISTILDLLAERDLTERKLLEYMNIKNLESIPEKDYQKALIAIKSAIKKNNVRLNGA